MGSLGDATDPIDCRRCGLCCVSRHGTVAQTREADWDRLKQTRRTDAVQGKRAAGAVKSREAPEPGSLRSLPVRRCVFLEGVVGQHTRCSIYDHRPAACRNFPAGRGICRGLRRDWQPG